MNQKKEVKNPSLEGGSKKKMENKRKPVDTMDLLKARPEARKRKMMEHKDHTLSDCSKNKNDSQRKKRVSLLNAQLDKSTFSHTINYLKTCEELNKIKLSRHTLGRIVHLPCFSEVVTGCYVKVNIGASNGTFVYRVAEVIGVVDIDKIYQLGGTKTNKGLKLKHANDERIFSMEYISNQRITDNEFLKWTKSMETCNLSLPSIDQVKSKMNDIEKAKKYEYNDGDVEYILKEKEKLKTDTHNFALKKTKLIMQRDMAESNNDEDEVSRLNIMLQKLEDEADKFYKKRTSYNSTNRTSIYSINKRNRESNFRAVKKARGTETVTKICKYDDLFKRQLTKPVLNVIKEELALQEVINDKKNNIMETVEIESRNDIKAADPFAVHNFDIDIDLRVLQSPLKVVPAVKKVLKKSAPRRSFNLEDYKKKRGLF